ncbi:MAG: phosphatidylglycerophosphatase A [Candidatus Azobacteroides sp.]|nr:phosphatidylglycerophosphatase A [Candidatus Azobacteroides sp.]
MAYPNYFFHKVIATGFGSGYFPKAPGTAGAVLAVGGWLILSFFLSSHALLGITFAGILLFLFLGAWSANQVEKEWGQDPPRVVIDEMVGVWIPLLAVSDGNIYFALLALAAFRLFDIFKPLGIKRMELFKKGWGIMLDDVLAGIYALLIILCLRCLIG